MQPNPFSRIRLAYPVDQSDSYQQYCQTSSVDATIARELDGVSQSPGASSVDNKPFPRRVDLWFAGLSIAVRKKLKPIDLTSQQTRELMYGFIFDSDSWRVQVVMLVAIAIDDDIEVVASPSRMMAIANGLAAAGVPYIVEMLEEGDQPPIWNLSDALEQLLTEE